MPCTAMTSLNLMVRRCEGLLGTDDINAWESNFLESILDRTNGGEDVSMLSEKQVDVLERIFQKHFAS
jgi:hypothetical protein